MIVSYLDPRTGQTFPLDVPRWHGLDRTPLMLTPLPGIDPGSIDRSVRSLWRYRAALPLPIDKPISMGEGCTPLVASELFGTPVRLKCDWLMPSGSFKDRGSSVMLSILRAQGISELLEDSSGNGGASIAAYAAAGGMRARIMVPDSTSAAKTTQIRAYGAQVELVPGNRRDTSVAAELAAEHTFYASHNWHPFFLQGTKTLAYELWEDLGFQAPDNIIVPCGAGSNVLGCTIGFAELVRAGQIAALPRIWAIQPENCSPIAASFAKQSRFAVETPCIGTIAEGTAISNPIRLPEVMDCLSLTNGGALTVTEIEIAQAVVDLANLGFYVEPTAAQVAAGFARLISSGQIASKGCHVIVLTGTGLKTSSRIEQMVGAG